MNEQIDHFEYDVSACVFVTETELDDIIRVALDHYDWGCKEAAKHGGFLDAWKYLYGSHKPTGEIVVQVREADRICKILEQEHHHGVCLYSRWYVILKAMLAERERLNAPWLVKDELRPKPYRDELKEKYGL